MRKNLILLIILIGQLSFSQEIIVDGQVFDESYSPYPQAQVFNINTGEKVTTDFYGNYTISAKIGDTLKFKANKQLENCYAPSYRLVYKKNDINGRLVHYSIINKEQCKLKKKEILVFIGKYSEIQWINNKDECYLQMYSEAQASYKVFQQIYGNFELEKEYIEFKVSEHIPVHSFIDEKHKYVLLFIGKYCDNKYFLITHRDIYKTKNNRWALTYNHNNMWYYWNIDTIENHIRDIKFKNASVRVRKKKLDNAKKSMKPPFYNIKGSKFIPVKGIYVEDYFKLWKSNQKEWKYDN